MNQSNNFGNMRDPKPMQKMTDKPYSEGGGNLSQNNTSQQANNSNNVQQNSGQRVLMPGFKTVSVKPENYQTSYTTTNDNMGFTNNKSGGFDAISTTSEDVEEALKRKIDTSTGLEIKSDSEIEPSMQINSQSPLINQFQNINPSVPYKEEFSTTVIGEDSNVILPKELPSQQPNFAYPIDENKKKRRKMIIMSIITIVILVIIFSIIFLLINLLKNANKKEITTLACTISEEDDEIGTVIDSTITYTFADDMGTNHEENIVYNFSSEDTYKSYRNSYTDDLIYDIDGITSENFFDSADLKYTLNISYDYDKMKKNALNKSKDKNKIEISTDTDEIQIEISNLKDTKKKMEKLGYECSK